VSSAVRRAVLDTIGRQQAALELAIEAGNIGMQFFIWQRMVMLESALGGGDGRPMAD
jgi:hypothetical protein